MEDTSSAMTAINIISVVASLVSLVIGGFAVWLSVTFYRLSNKVSEETKEAAKGISASVDRLETLFDRLYSDTFSMMRETVTDMRNHVWGDKEKDSDIAELIEENSKQKIKEIKEEVTAEFANLMSQIGEKEDRIQIMQSEMQKLLDKAIKQTRKVEEEAQEEYSLADVLNSILAFVAEREYLTLGSIRLHPKFRGVYPFSALREAVSFLVKEGLLEAQGPEGQLKTKYVYTGGLRPVKDDK